MKHQIKAIPALRVTAIGYDPVKGKDVPVSKICHKAKVAAEHYATTRTYSWWHKASRQRTVFDYAGYFAALERRSLKVFQKYLP